MKKVFLFFAQLACGILTRGKHEPTDDPILGRFCKKCLKKLGPA